MLTTRLQRRRRERCNIRPETRVRCRGHLQFLRGYPCCTPTTGLVRHSDSRISCNGRIEAAHVRIGTDGAMGIKSSDCYAVPLCAAHHHQQHNIGEVSFAKLYGVNLKKMAANLWQYSPHGTRYRREQEKANG